eukprot:TRINITY_DN3160_c2_g2_i1.p1 TRINITY_DN3160_c2_g2~~TRINITY_DN3160_c2_g2_i1.p1  ORF type:complete len:532 (-),score=175.77 TRINITY_DN3160_c2_g2_i1:180-1751(-)
MTGPVCVIVRDGWGKNPNTEMNAIAAANIPNNDMYLDTYPNVVIEASGEPVGVPDGCQGSSEVGHLNMGAGRIVIQEIKRINDEMLAETFFDGPKFKELSEQWISCGSSLHLFGLLQDEGVHAHIQHLLTLMDWARATNPVGKIIIHPFLDGRDTPPRSTEQYIARLQKHMEKLGNCEIGTIMGRYYGMDRAWNRELTNMAYNAIVFGEGKKVENVIDAVKASYDNDKTPDGSDMTDEYIPPHSIGNYSGMLPNDVVVHTNYRQDRAIQLSMAFVDPEGYAGNIKPLPEGIKYLGFTQYYDAFNNYILEPMSSGGGMENLLTDVLAENGINQLRIAETQKFAHVTSFFNGKSTTPAKGEDQVKVPSRFDPATFAKHPEMEAYNVTDKILSILEETPEKYGFILVNYANTDMVGHTGVFEAAKKAAEVVDECVGRVVNRILELGGHVLLTADHGNADQMIDYETGLIKTSHSCNPVDLIWISNDINGRKLVPGDNPKLADIAPTVLHLLELPIPVEMTANNLVE